MSKSIPLLKATGISLEIAGRFVGKQALSIYRQMDPDVPRHILQIPLLSYSLLSSWIQPPGKPSKKSFESQKADGHRPLVFAHGLGGSHGDFIPMIGFFWLNGRKRTYRMSFSGHSGIEQMANALTLFVDHVREVTGEKKVDLIAHSLGGIASRLAILDYGLSRKVGTFITLGSPHQGTHSARYANSAVLRSLRPDSPFMKRISKKPWPKSVKGISLWSKNDLLILPSESAMLDGTKTVEMTPFTHYSYLLHPQSWSTVFSLLK